MKKAKYKVGDKVDCMEGYGVIQERHYNKGEGREYEIEIIEPVYVTYMEDDID